MNYCINARGPLGILRHFYVDEDSYPEHAESIASDHGGEAWVWGKKDSDGLRPFVGRAAYVFASGRIFWYPADPNLRIFWKE